MTKELNNTDNKSSMKKRFRRNNQQMKQIKEEVVDFTFRIFNHWYKCYD